MEDEEVQLVERYVVEIVSRFTTDSIDSTVGSNTSRESLSDGTNVVIPTPATVNLPEASIDSQVQL